MSVEKAMLNHHAKIARKSGQKITKDKSKLSPEKQVEREVLSWSKDNDFDLTVIESKAVYNVQAGRYMDSMTSESMPDLCGNKGPLACFIELKAMGKLKTLKEHQREFLVRKIKQGCFAVCVDGSDSLARLWKSYSLSVDKISFLLNSLPKRTPKQESEIKRNEVLSLFGE